ncbi:deoxyribonuclease V [Planktothricoides sp. FACHB-1370]|uniref:Endonuclease V n=1 Tax=Planktothricoides raciborskii FACHB-1370 TaxID=2949576 RepID=A0ABR8EPP5_9CYAN|nr:endonuclease V [Planktothricoides sp. SR001]MBD2547562.1 deoxyribonuclease V [Planktothricoides raciborskii FACHB-1370]MBD2586039.1 deoxyribonuclease V [Planktothricoides raciborskii FACHB-1261]
MPIHRSHPWPQNESEALLIQEKLRSQTISTLDMPSVNPSVKYVAGVDVSYSADDTIAKAAVVVLSFPDLQLCDQAIACGPTTFPYIPGFLSFREVPPVLDALAKLTICPDLLLCDGHGLAHPRRFGLACHLGVLTNIPTIGVAKSRYIGQHDPLGEKRGSWQPLIDQGEIVGAVVRSRTGVQPIYVSIGHRLDLATAIDYVLQCTPKYRLPETTRQADQLASM